MPQYLVAIYHRDDYDPSVETEETRTANLKEECPEIK